MYGEALVEEAGIQQQVSGVALKTPHRNGCVQKTQHSTLLHASFY
jgi:hypothetical protein